MARCSAQIDITCMRALQMSLSGNFRMCARLNLKFSRDITLGPDCPRRRSIIGSGREIAQQSGRLNQEAVAHFRNATELLETLPDRAAHAEQELQLLIALGPALMTTRSSASPEIEQVYARARELAHKLQRIADLFPTVWGASLVTLTAGDLATSARLVVELIDKR